MSLQVENIEKHFGGNNVLRGISFEIIPNAINLLIGPNGSGKTTLINIISGLIPSDGGNISFKDHSITNKTPDKIFQKGIIRTFQTPRLFPNLSVLENLLLADTSIVESYRHSLHTSKWKSVESELVKKALSTLKSLDLIHLKDSLAQDLSGGQIKLVELAKSLMSESRLILLDEPIAMINPTLAHKIFARISNMCKDQRRTFLIIEHRLDIALKYADYVFVMAQGQIIAHDKPDKILQNKKVIQSYLG